MARRVSGVWLVPLRMSVCSHQIGNTPTPVGVSAPAGVLFVRLFYRFRWLDRGHHSAPAAAHRPAAASRMPYV